MNIKGAKIMAAKTSGHGKTHFTVLACCTDGTKLPPMIMFKRKTFPKERIQMELLSMCMKKDG